MVDTYPPQVSTFKVVGRLVKGVADTADVGADPDLIPIVGAQVTFTPNLNPPVFRVPTATPPATVFQESIVATTDVNGYLKIAAETELGVILVNGTDPDIVPNNWTWTVSISVGGNFPVRVFSFSGMAGGVVDLATIIPVAASSGTDLAPWVSIVSQTSSARDAAVLARNEAQSARDEIIDLTTTGYLAPSQLSVTIEEVAQPLGVSSSQNPTMVKPLAEPLFFLEDQAASSLYWPRLVDLSQDGVSTGWAYFYSTDHAASHLDSGLFAASGPTPFEITTFHGRIYRDDLGGGSQCETPSPVWDAKANLWRIFYQKAGVTGTNSLQVTLMATAPAGQLLNGAAWTRFGVVIDALPSSPIPGESKHLGYFDAYKDRSGWYGTGLVGGTFGGSRIYRSMDGETWFPVGRVPAMHPHMFSVLGVAPGPERWASLRPKPFLWRGDQWGLWIVQQSASGTEDTFTARMAVGRLSSDMRNPVSPLVDITPPVQAWEFETVAGTSMDSVGNPVPYGNVLLVPFRSGLGEGGISVAAIGA